MQTIYFKKQGYDPFIDFLKGVCILWVVMDHALPLGIKDKMLFCLWGDMAVPLFLFIQCIHIYKKEDANVSINWSKAWKRIIKPFLLVECLIISIGLSAVIIKDKSVLEYLWMFISHGGIGRGSYYPKMYLQFAIIIPLMLPLFKWNKYVGGGILLLVSHVAELYFCYTDNYLLWQWVCVRYLFLIFLGYYIANEGIKKNISMFFISIPSAALILIFYYSSISFCPIFYDNPWRIFRWPSYFHVSLLLIYLIFKLFKRVPEKIRSYIMLMGRCSYEIFLFQMLVFFLFDAISSLLKLRDANVIGMIYSLFVTCLCIIPVVWFMKKSDRPTRVRNN